MRWVWLVAVLAMVGAFVGVAVYQQIQAILAQHSCGVVPVCYEPEPNWSFTIPVAMLVGIEAWLLGRLAWLFRRNRRSTPRPSESRDIQ